MVMGLNLKLFHNIIERMHKNFKELRDQYQWMKHFIKGCKSGKSKIKSIGKRCHEKDLVDPVECYYLIEGPIKYTKEQRKQWEKRMAERAKKMGVIFKPTDYMLTDLVEGE